MTEKKPIVAVHVLHMGYWGWCIALQMISLSHDPRYDVRIMAPSDQPISSNRNRICLEARRKMDADWILMCDADARLGGNPLDMIEKDLDIVAWPALCYKRNRLEEDPPRDPFAWNMVNHDRYGNKFDETSLEHPVERGAIGAHIMLISRRVLDHPDMRAPFMDEFDKDGLRLSGEDLLFCFRAREAGFKVWTVLSEPSGHIKEVDLLVPRRLIDEAKTR